MQKKPIIIKVFGVGLFLAVVFLLWLYLSGEMNRYFSRRAVSYNPDDPNSALYKLNQLFEYSDGYYHYPEDFGGAWVEDDKLCVYIFDVKRMPYYQDYLADYRCVQWKYLEFGSKERSVIAAEVMKFANTVWTGIEFTGGYSDFMSYEICFLTTGDVEETRDRLTRLVQREVRKPLTSFLSEAPYLKEMLKNTNILHFIVIEQGEFSLD